MSTTTAAGSRTCPTSWRDTCPNASTPRPSVVTRQRCPSAATTGPGKSVPDWKNFRGLSDEQLLTLRFEDLLAQPVEHLDRFFRFLLRGASDIDLGACASLVRRPSSDWRSLPLAEADALGQACRPGFAALAAHGHAQTL